MNSMSAPMLRCAWDQAAGSCGARKRRSGMRKTLMVRSAASRSTKVQTARRRLNCSHGRLRYAMPV